MDSVVVSFESSSSFFPLGEGPPTTNRDNFNAPLLSFARNRCILSLEHLVVPQPLLSFDLLQIPLSTFRCNRFCSQKCRVILTSCQQCLKRETYLPSAGLLPEMLVPTIALVHTASIWMPAITTILCLFVSHHASAIIPSKMFIIGSQCDNSGTDDHPMLAMCAEIALMIRRGWDKESDGGQIISSDLRLRGKWRTSKKWAGAHNHVLLHTQNNQIFGHVGKPRAL